MYSTILDEFENYQDNRDLYSVKEKKKLLIYFEEELKIMPEKPSSTKFIF